MGHCFCYVYINKNALFKFTVVFTVLNIQKSISLNDLDERILNNTVIWLVFPLLLLSMKKGCFQQQVRSAGCKESQDSLWLRCSCRQEMMISNDYPLFSIEKLCLWLKGSSIKRKLFQTKIHFLTLV